METRESLIETNYLCLAREAAMNICLEWRRIDYLCDDILRVIMANIIYVIMARAECEFCDCMVTLYWRYLNSGMSIRIRAKSNKIFADVLPNFGRKLGIIICKDSTGVITVSRKMAGDMAVTKIFSAVAANFVHCGLVGPNAYFINL